MDKIKVKINIAENEFTILSNDDEAYTISVAQEVDKKIAEICSASPQSSVTAAAMLAALNFCDSAKKSEKDADNFRMQIKDYLIEAAKVKLELDGLKRENERLKKDIQTYRQRLSEEASPRRDTQAPVSKAVKAVKKSVFVSDFEEAEDDSSVNF